jgi:hypothetical protein
MQGPFSNTITPAAAHTRSQNEPSRRTHSKSRITKRSQHVLENNQASKTHRNHKEDRRPDSTGSTLSPLFLSAFIGVHRRLKVFS